MRPSDDGSGRGALSSRAPAIVIVLFAVAYLAETFRFRVGFAADPIGPRAFPLLLGISLLLVGLWLVARPGRRQDSDTSDTLSPPLHARSLVIGGLLFGLYPAALVWLGFVVATSVTLTALALLLGANGAKAFLASFSFSIVLFAVFARVLALPIPLGRLVELFVLSSV